ncbi:uncharacterized protein LOC128199674 [Bicyclus anynana]|uniref:Uncharacterized protein LOC128199674 n=1 Tax=Bicyclus anynana TaxID=110368 RepID=A0ABM3M436_BICAN|nr:uncharacterized protein LOC128199674 [Bicyclus anynana]XP_052746145.1 uncharacterized protein LOC128199674 [Bicyclus anynana]XP_052746146.1 uncharacterized protein LOC128199674 [Bicyclus anynana]
MENSELKTQLNILICKKENIFQRLNRLYDSSKAISTFESRKNDTFMNESETIDALHAKFENILDSINDLLLQINPKAQPDYQALDSFEDLYSTVKRVRNKILSNTNNNLSNTKNEAPATHINLAPIQIPCFDGKPQNWAIFYETFKANVHLNKNLTDSQRVQYLISKLTQGALTFTAGLVPNGDTYNIIWNNLVKKYQDKRALATHYLNNIFDLKNCSNNVNSLNMFIEKFSSSVAALKQIDISDLTDFILLHCALRKMDSQIIQNFEMSLQSKNIDIPTYTQLVEFVQMQVKILERSNTSLQKISNSNSRNTYKTLIAQTDFSSNNATTNSCELCNQSHSNLYHCKKFIEINDPLSRFEFIKSKNGCINCLSLFHNLRSCKSRVTCFCNKKHHKLLHRDNNNTKYAQRNTSAVCNNAQSETARIVPSPFDARINTSQNYVASFSNARHTNTLIKSNMNEGRSNILLASVVVRATPYKKRNKVDIRCLLDIGSQNNVITLKCCQMLSLPIKPIYNSFIKGIGMSSQPIHGYVTLDIQSRIYPMNKYNIRALVLDCLTDQLPTQYVNTCNMDYISDIPLADPTWNIPGGIDLILGAELFPHIYIGKKIIPETHGPAALLTTFGYILMGSCNQYCEQSNNSFTALAINELSFDLQNFWELDQIPVKKHFSPADIECEKLYSESISRNENGRYSVALPFCKNPTTFNDSYRNAYRRLISLERRLNHDSTLRTQYNQIINDYLSLGYISEVNDLEKRDEGFYLAHHPIIRPEKITSPVRIVIDPSVKNINNISLNDILHVGPNLQADLFTLLLNFRLFPVAMTADIKQMYLQIEVTPRDRKYLKFLFRFHDKEHIRIFHFNRVPFGLKSSPYLAMRTLQQLCSEENKRFPLASEIAKSQFYMDDLVHSEPNEETAKELSRELVSLFKSGAFELVKWTSNSTSLLDNLPNTHRTVVNFSDKNNICKVLGLAWEPKPDIFHFTISKLDDKCTKRTILSFVARLFDVLGLVSPVILYAKLLIKELWINKVDWDDTPCENVTRKYLALTKEFSLLSDSLQIPRHTGIKEGSKVNIVAFCDASLNGYGCVVYLHITDSHNNIIVNLLCSKSKVSPLKITTLARLELCAALLMSKLVKIVKETYSTRINIEEIYAFSDSTIALSWIKSSPHRWNTFVSNRVSQCQENLDPQHFYHVAGIENPSDCLSRGMLPAQLISHSLWWNGPEWLNRPPSEWPKSDFFPATYETLPEFKSNTLIITNVQCEQSILYNLTQRFSSWNKLIRTVLYVYRFARLLPDTGEVNKIFFVENALIKEIQRVHFADEITRLKNKQLPSKKLQKLSVFLDDKGIVRIGGRLSNADLPYEAKHPALLPKHDHAVDLIIDNYHLKNCHTGAGLLMSIIRQRFWILDARTVIRSRIHKCNICFRMKPSHPSPIMADLPSYRLQEAKAFLFTGIDHAGPIRITLTRRRGYQSQKAYICLFVCLVTKAIHIELASDLTSDNMISCLNRFLSRRGPVNTIWTDMSGTFIGAKAQLDEIYSLLLSSDYKNEFGLELQKKTNRMENHSAAFSTFRWNMGIKYKMRKSSPL